VTLLVDARTRHGDKMGALIENPARWSMVRGTVGRIIKVMPLWKLQTVRGRALEFLYPNGTLVDGAIELYPGIAFCFRRFHELIQDLVQGAWVRFVRNLPANQPVLGQSKDLAEFMFGSERANLADYVGVLRQPQGRRRGRSLYPLGALPGGPGAQLRVGPQELQHREGRSVSRQAPPRSLVGARRDEGSGVGGGLRLETSAPRRGGLPRGHPVGLRERGSHRLEGMAIGEGAIAPHGGLATVDPMMRQKRGGYDGIRTACTLR
jgi:hypothetical protein